MKRTPFVLICIAALAISLSGCQGLSGPTQELYVSVDGDYGTVECELYLISYLEPGRSSDTGKNIYGSRLRTETISGREWMVFGIPEGRWDIYLEYYTHGAYDSTHNDRNTVSLDINEWAALWLPSDDWTSTRRAQGDGQVSIPGL